MALLVDDARFRIEQRKIDQCHIGISSHAPLRRLHHSIAKARRGRLVAGAIRRRDHRLWWGRCEREQLYLEHQVGIGGDRPAALRSIAERSRNAEAVLSARLHQFQSLCKAEDHAADFELCALASVKLAAIGRQAAAIIDLHPRICARFLARTRLDHGVRQALGSFDLARQNRLRRGGLSGNRETCKDDGREGGR